MKTPLAPLLSPTAWELRQTSLQVVAEIDALLDDYTKAEIARILNDGGHLSGEGKRFHAGIVQRLRRDYDMKKRHDRLRDAGMLSLEEMADLLGIATDTVKEWRNHDLLPKGQGGKLSKRRRFPNVASNRAEEVQCEA